MLLQKENENNWTGYLKYNTQSTSPHYTVGAASVGFSFCFDVLGMGRSTWNHKPEKWKRMDGLPAERT